MLLTPLKILFKAPSSSPPFFNLLSFIVMNEAKTYMDDSGNIRSPLHSFIASIPSSFIPQSSKPLEISWQSKRKLNERVWTIMMPYFNYPRNGKLLFLDISFAIELARIELSLVQEHQVMTVNVVAKNPPKHTSDSSKNNGTLVGGLDSFFSALWNHV